MSVLNKLILTYGSGILKNLDKERKNPVPFQMEMLGRFIDKAGHTMFGKEHGFDGTIESFMKNVPFREYDDFTPYIDRIMKGEDNVLWPGHTGWMAKSSGTSSSKSKFLPVTHESLHKCHFSGMTAMLISYLNANPDSRVFSGKALTLGGSVSPHATEAGKSHIMAGDLSGIMLSNSPAIAEFSRRPSRSVATIADFDRKVEEICKSCSKQKITSISGVPSWNLVMLKRIMEYNSAKNISEVWPGLELFMHGGTSMNPYRDEYRRIIPSSNMKYLENYNASEGYFAFQDDSNDKSMLLCCNNNVFYEFIPVESLDRVIAGEHGLAETVENVSVGKAYALAITTNAGLWRYLIGDTVMFTSLYPHKIRILGRTKLFINAFGEELMISNADEAIADACRICGATVNEYTVAPVFMTAEKKGGHEWAIEFTMEPEDMEQFAETLDKCICSHNSDYEAKRNSGVMDILKLRVMKKGSFMKWMETRGRLGGQNKVPRLSNDRKILESLIANSEK